MPEKESIASKTSEKPSQQSVDEFISDSYNRMGIADQTNPRQVYNTGETSENNINHHHQLQTLQLQQQPVQQSQRPNQTTFECDSFDLNNLRFIPVESPDTDLANVVPSMNELCPQTFDLMNAFYNTINSNDLDNFYGSSQSQTHQQQ